MRRYRIGLCQVRRRPLVVPEYRAESGQELFQAPSLEPLRHRDWFPAEQVSTEQTTRRPSRKRGSQIAVRLLSAGFDEPSRLPFPTRSGGPAVERRWEHYQL